MKTGGGGYAQEKECNSEPNLHKHCSTFKEQLESLDLLELFHHEDKTILGFQGNLFTMITSCYTGLCPFVVSNQVLVQFR